MDKNQFNYRLPLKNGVILIKNLSNIISKQHIYEIFSSYGDILSIIKHKEKSYFVEYSDERDSSEAYKYMNKAYIDGNIIEIIRLSDILEKK